MEALDEKRSTNHEAEHGQPQRTAGQAARPGRGSRPRWGVVVTRLNILAHEFFVARDAMRIASRQAAESERAIVKQLKMDDGGGGVVCSEDYLIEVKRDSNGTAVVNVEKRRDLYPCCEG